MIACRYYLPILICGLLAGCTPQGEDQPITKVREIPKEKAMAGRPMVTAERLGLRTPEDPHAQATPPAMPMPEAPAADLTWSAPEGWRQLEDRPMRLVTYTADEAGESQCYISILGGAAGGEEANFNRWRMQMGLGPLRAEELAALPVLSMLGEEVRLLSVQGDYSGMGGASQRNQMLLGVVCPSEDRTVFVKMLGPEALIKEQIEAFKAFCTSLKAS